MFYVLFLSCFTYSLSFIFTTFSDFSPQNCSLTKKGQNNYHLRSLVLVNSNGEGKNVLQQKVSPVFHFRPSAVCNSWRTTTPYMRSQRVLSSVNKFASLRRDSAILCFSNPWSFVKTWATPMNPLGQRKLDFLVHPEKILVIAGVIAL